METVGRVRLAEVLVGICDPRQAKKVEHHLVEVLVVAVCAVLSGDDDFVEIETWGKARLQWLRQFLKLEHGIASHDTVGRVFAAIDAEQFGAAFRGWVAGVLPALDKDEVVSIDGKSSRRSALDHTPLHLVRASTAHAGLVLGQSATAQKSNAKTAIPELLLTLDLEGCIVTIDAMGPRPSIAATIRSRKADYVLAVKDSQPKLAESIWQFWRDFQAAPHTTPQLRRDDRERSWPHRSAPLLRLRANRLPACPRALARSACVRGDCRRAHRSGQEQPGASLLHHQSAA